MQTPGYEGSQLPLTGIYDVFVGCNVGGGVGVAAAVAVSPGVFVWEGAAVGVDVFAAVVGDKVRVIVAVTVGT